MALKPFNSVAGYSVGEVPANIILANGDITTTNITTTGVSNLNSVGNVKISGGTAGQVISTDGAGNLSFINVSTSGLSNGTSNIAIINNGNITFSVGGTANVVVVTDTGINVAGTLNASGNANVGNIGATNGVFTNITGTLTTSSQPNITSVGTLVDLTVTGNATAGNFYANSGTIGALTLKGEGGNISNIQGGNVSGAVASATSATNASAVLNNVSSTGTVYPTFISSTANGNYSLTSNTAYSANIANGFFGATLLGGTLTTSSQPNITSVGTLSSLDVSANVTAGGVKTDNLYYANGSPWDLQQPGGSNTQIQFNDADSFGGSAAFTFDKTSNLVTVSANLNANNLNATTYITAGNVYANSGIIGAQTLKGEGGNISNIQGGNVSGAVASATTAGTVTTNAQPNITSVGTLTSLAVTGNVTAGNVSGANLISANFLTGTLITSAQPNITSVGTLTTLNVTGNANVGNIGATNGVFTNVSGNGSALSSITGANVTGQVGNALIAGTVYTNAQPNITSVGTLTSLTVSGNTTVGNLSTGNGAGGSITGANLISANYLSGTITTNAQPNITSVGTLTSLAVTGNASAGNISTTGVLSVTGNANAGNLGTAGQILATGNITSNANVVTDYVAARTGNLRISTNAANSSIVLDPNGTGVVDVSSSRISNVAEPNLASDAATKYYVDNAVSAGITFHPAVNVETPTALNATYADGGTTPTWTSITTTDTLNTGSAHNLSVNDVIVFGSTTNGITAGTAYLVAEVPSSTSIKITTVWSGSPITTLTNGTGLTITSRANSGAGATLTNAGTQAAIQIDGVNLSLNDRVLVYRQTNEFENGIYTVTTVGSGSTNWVLTRANDANTYIPNSPDGMSSGDFFYVKQGLSGAGESYINNTPGIIVFGTTNITYAQFSDTQIYTAGTGLTLNGTQFSISNTAVVAGSYGNGDNVATFTVNSQGQLTAASNTAITANAANLTGTTLASSIVNSSLTSVGTLTGLNVNGNITAANITANTGVFTGNGSGLSAIAGANVTGQVGNALIAGTVYTNAQPNITSVGTLTSLDVTGNVTSGNVYANSGIVGAQTLKGEGGNISNIQGANVSGTVSSATTAGTVTANAQPNITSVGTLTSLSVTGNVSSGNISATNGNLTTANISGNLILGNSSITTAISYGSVTTTSITANQTIASFSTTGVTGVEFLVKSIDSSGSRYGVATVIAVTDGTNVDYSTFGTVNLGGYTGALAVNISGGQVRLQVTPASSNSTVWTTQMRLL